MGKTGHKLCDSQVDWQSVETKCMYVQHACGRELDKYPSKLRLGMT